MDFPKLTDEALEAHGPQVSTAGLSGSLRLRVQGGIVQPCGLGALGVWPVWTEMCCAHLDFEDLV